MIAQLYMWSGTRELLFEKHRFFVEQVKGRLLAQFEDLEGQADRYADEVYASLGRAPGYGDMDMADMADIAHENSIGYYSQLVDLRKQVLLGGVAGMFHQWDKDLREFLERELLHAFAPEAVEKAVWAPAMDTPLGILGEFGWNVRSLPFYPDLDACNLVVNVFKHGKGRSLKHLSERHPRFVVDPLLKLGWQASPLHRLDHEWLTVVDADLDVFAEAIRSFWREFPERLYLSVPIRAA